MIDKIALSRYNTKSIQGQRRLSSYYPNAQDNLLSNYLNSLYNNSPTHQCIVDDIAQQVTGLGLTTDDKEKATLLNELLGKKKVFDIVRTYLIQEALNIQIKRNPLKDIIKLENINPAQFRVVEMQDGTPTRLAYRPDWNPQSSLYNSRNSYFNTYNNEDEISILYHYNSGTYFTPYGRPSYLSAADAIELEIAIYMMHNHGAQNGMFPSMVVSKETSGDDEIDRADSERTQSQTAGAANAGKIITTYYPKGGNAPTFSTPNLTGLDKIYSEQYLSAEIGILKGWRIPSANLISGLNSKGSGFTSETEELVYAKNELNEKIIKPKREDILDILDPIFKELEIEDVYFKDVEEEDKVEPIEVTQLAEEKEKDFDDDSMLESLEGETIDLEEWELVDSREANDEDCEEWANRLIKPKLTRLESIKVKLAGFVKSAPNKKSALDKDIYKVRYTYEEISGTNRAKSRKFCKNMMARTDRGVVYRKEDIDEASFRGVNNNFGHKGMNYSLWLYAGGKYCHHYWKENLYRLKTKTDGTPYKDKALSSSEEVEKIKGYNPNPNGWDIAKTAPIKRVGRGAYR